jgi:hypothetical protein
MLKIEDMLTAAVTTFMACDQPSAMPDLDMLGRRGPHPGLANATGTSNQEKEVFSFYAALAS